MLRAKLVKNGTSRASHLSSVVVVVCLIIGWSRPAFSDEPAAAPDEQPHLQLAPINLHRTFGGSIGYLFQRTTIGASKSMQQSLGVEVTAGIGVSSFLWQPWLAQVSSNLTAGVNGTSTNSSTNGNSTPTYNSANTSINGDAALNVLNKSRFPFQARIYRQDSRYAAFYSGSNLVTQTTGYNLNQGYKSRNLRTTADASFASSKSGGSDISPNYSDVFNFTLGLQPARYNTISISGNATRQNTPAQGRSSVLDTLLANHAYRPNPIFSVGNFANLVKMSYDLTQGSSPTQFDASSLQFSSFASLRPEKSPLTMTGSVRFLRSDSSSNGILAPALKSSNFNLGANYLFSKLIRMYGSVNVADSLGTQSVSTDAALTAAKPYRATIIDNLGGFRYSGTIGGSLSTNNKTSTSSANQTTTQNAVNLGVYLSHALDKDSELGAGHLAKNLNQTISMGVSDGGSSLSNLTSGGSLTWHRAEGKGTTLLRLSATDSRNLRGTHQLFQMINLQASRSEAISHNESLQGNLTVQATRQESGIQQNAPNTITPSAEMNYRNQRAFKVRNLVFDSILRIADSNISPGSQDQATRSWDNNFAYRIGHLNIRLNTNMSMFNDTLRTSIMFMMSRGF